jgi:hypothetical protein
MWLLPESHVQLFPFILVSSNRATALKYRAALCTHHVATWERIQDGGVVCSTPRFNKVLKLTNYHILGIWLVHSKT